MRKSMGEFDVAGIHLFVRLYTKTPVFASHWGAHPDGIWHPQGGTAEMTSFQNRKERKPSSVESFPANRTKIVECKGLERLSKGGGSSKLKTKYRCTPKTLIYRNESHQ